MKHNSPTSDPVHKNPENDGKKKNMAEKKQNSPKGWNQIVAFELDIEPDTSAGKDVEPKDEPDETISDSKWVTKPPKDICGLALSGGGIRSSTFNLGLLQGLNKYGILNFLDYVSTVSGGGYVGGFWTAWRSRKNNSGDTIFPRQNNSSDASMYDRPDAETKEIRHLREFSNFLVPRLGLFSVDAGRIVISILSAVIPSLIFSFGTLAVVLLIYKISAALMTVSSGIGPPVLPLATIILITALILIITEVIWPEPLTKNQKLSYRLCGVIAVIFVGFLWFWIAEKNESVINIPALLPAYIWVLTSLLFVIAIWLFSRINVNFKIQTAISSARRVAARLLYVAGVWVVVFGLWWFAEYIFDFFQRQPSFTALVASVLAALSGMFARIQLLVGRKTKKPVGESVGSKLKPFIPQLLAYTAVGIMFVMIGIVLIALSGGTNGIIFGQPSGNTAGIFSDNLFILKVLGIVLFILLFTALTMDPNRVSLHSFYRSRIARAYLGASLDSDEKAETTEKIKSAKSTERYVEEQEDDDIPLSDCTQNSPLHLICCAANDLASKDVMTSLYRGAASAVLSPKAFSVDNKWKAWNELEFKSPSLGAAVTASAAALNSHMGSMSMKLGPAVRFLMTALNLRLGLWTLSPESNGHSIIRKIIPGSAFIKEMLGISTIDGNEVLLSDGGHFENMGLYELIRRHCRYIILSDCGMDSDIAFDDFGNAVRRIRSDFGVDIQIDLSPLKPGKNGFSRQSMVAGDIHYPTGDTGILLYYKPTMVGNEPADVLQYHNRNASFPHESTGDQFYDEAQWESYRRLGEHAADVALGPVIKKLSGGNDEEKKRLMFTQARRDWLPLPEGYADRVSHFTGRITELDSQLLTSECYTLLSEVFKEIPEIDRQMFDYAEKDKHEKDKSIDGKRNAQSLDSKELGPALHIIRRALYFMEEVYLNENLESNHNHPLYLGIMNYFARWTLSPTFQMWWPIVKSMYPQQFIQFIESHFSLKPVDPVSFIKPVESVQGFARSCWEENRKLLENEHIVQYCRNMQYHDKNYFINAAFVIFTRIKDLVVWKNSDFCVPPGLWGMGIGGDFLSQLMRNKVYGQDESSGQKNVTGILVAIQITDTDDPAVLKSQANEIYFYRSAGFREPTEQEMIDLVGVNDLENYFKSSEHKIKWMLYSC